MFKLSVFTFQPFVLRLFYVYKYIGCIQLNQQELFYFFEIFINRFFINTYNQINWLDFYVSIYVQYQSVWERQ